MILDRSELEKYLEQNPWPIDFSQEKQVEYIHRFHTPLSPTEAWKHIYDSPLINNQPGLQSMSFAEKDGRLYGKGRSGWIRHEWEEMPWQWEYPSNIRFARVYSRGIAGYVRIHIAIKESGNGGSDVYMYTGWVPRGIAGRIFLRLLAKRNEKKLRQVFEKPAEQNMPEKPESGDEQIANFRTDIVNSGAPGPEADALFNHVMHAPDTELCRMRPAELTAGTDLSTDRMLRTMLISCKAGLLEMSWDVVCPHCRGVRARYAHLVETGESASCPLCSIDFNPGSADMIDITFTLNPAVRKIPYDRYIRTEPARKSHIILQKFLHPGSNSMFSLPQFEERLRFRIHGRKYYGILDLKNSAPLRNLYWDDISSSRIIEAAPGSTVFLSNTGTDTTGYIIELADTDMNALRPALVFSSQEFRDLFPDESVPPGLAMDPGVRNIMFIDVADADVFYTATGDTAAFHAIRGLFSAVHEKAAAHSGAIVRTQGNGMLLTFHRAMDAVRAGISMLKSLSAEGETTPPVRITLHRGECFAVKLGSNIDYFGQAVNTCTMLAVNAGSREMLMSEAFAAETTVASYLDDRGYTRSFATADITGTSGERYLKIKIKK